MNLASEMKLSETGPIPGKNATNAHFIYMNGEKLLSSMWLFSNRERYLESDTLTDPGELPRPYCAYSSHSIAYIELRVCEIGPDSYMRGNQCGDS